MWESNDALYVCSNRAMSLIFGVFSAQRHTSNSSTRRHAVKRLHVGRLVINHMDARITAYAE